jgi:toxin secretion/phage lysis holin
MKVQNIALITAAPFTVLAELLKYIYQDWEFAKWIAVAIALDTLLGMVKAFIHKDLSSEEFWRRFWKKIVGYLALLILSNILTNYTVGGEVVGATQWIGTYLCSYMLIREAISVLENVNAIVPIAPRWLLERMKDFNEKGEYIKKDTQDEDK